MVSMRSRGRHALFHAIVTMGAASAQACGGETTDASRRDDPGGSVGTGGATTLFAGSGSGTASSSSGGYSGMASTGLGFGATGDASPETTPVMVDGGLVLSGCEHPEQIHCATWDPAPRGCSCDASAPISQSDCPACSAFACRYYMPNVGCQCVVCIR